jgi:membrane protein DedA with SNARE-associated domain
LIAVFLLALSEAVPVVGTVVPGSTAILGISALATTAQLDPWLLLMAATLGAIAGDGFSFWLGMRYHAEVLRGWPLNRYPQLIARSKAHIERYGIASVFLARFTAVVRAFVPMLAGVLRMSPPHFYAANVASALVWAPMLSRRAARHGDQLRRRQRRAAHPTRSRRGNLGVGLVGLAQSEVARDGGRADQAFAPVGRTRAQPASSRVENDRRNSAVRGCPVGPFLQEARGRSGLLLLTFVHEALLRRALERFAVRADRLGSARVALAFRHEARSRGAGELLAVFSHGLAFTCDGSLCRRGSDGKRR